MSKAFVSILSIVLLSVFPGCKPDKIEVEIYTSDVQQVSTGDIVEIPLTAIFSLIGEDTSGNLPRASAVAKHYLNENAEFKISKGDWGDALIVKCKIPMGTEASINSYLANNRRPLAFVVDGSSVMLKSTQHIGSLNRELSGINMMLDLDMPAKSTIVRLIGDMTESPQLTAIAVFVDEKPELVLKKSIKRRETVEFEFNGEDASVYSEVPIQFFIDTKK